MGILNGAFDTDLSSWITAITGDADVLWDNSGLTPGRARLRVYQCSEAHLSQSVVIDGGTLTFDWQTGTDNWMELPEWKLTIGGTVIYNEMFTLNKGTGYSGTKTVDVSPYIGQTAVLEFYILPSIYCANGDHANTYLWIDNVKTQCTPNRQCEPGQTGYETDGCGNRRANPACLTTGSASFSSTPPGAEIFIDGSDQGVMTPATITSIPTGSHDYTLKLAGFLDSTGTVQVVENQTITVSTQLIPVEGCIYFITSVPGAKIYVDNVDTGKVTPALVCGLSLATHTYMLVLPGYAVITGSVVLGTGQGATITGTLVREAKKGAGALVLVTLLGLGALGAVIFATREKKQTDYTPPAGR